MDQVTYIKTKFRQEQWEKLIKNKNIVDINIKCYNSLYRIVF